MVSELPGVICARIRLAGSSRTPNNEERQTTGLEIEWVEGILIAGGASQNNSPPEASEGSPSKDSGQDSGADDISSRQNVS